MENKITFEDFKKVELRVGKVIEASEVENSDKLLKLKVDIGGEERQILAGIKKFYKSEDLMDKEIIIVANLEPRSLMGLESQGMLLAADNNGEPILIMPDKEAPSGAEVR